MNNLDLITQKIITVADTITAEITAKAPAALQLILNAARMEALQQLIYGGVMLIVTIISGVLIYFYIKKITKIKNFESAEGVAFMITGVLGFLLLLAIFFTDLSVFYNFFDVFNWVGLWHPDIYLAHQVLQHVQDSKNAN